MSEIIMMTEQKLSNSTKIYTTPLNLCSFNEMRACQLKLGAQKLIFALHVP